MKMTVIIDDSSTLIASYFGRIVQERAKGVKWYFKNLTCACQMCQDATKYNTHVNWFHIMIWWNFLGMSSRARLIDHLRDNLSPRILKNAVSWNCWILRIKNFRENLIWVKISWNDIYIHSLSIQVYSWMYICIYIVGDSYLLLCANKMSCDTNVRWRHLRGWFMLD